MNAPILPKRQCGDCTQCCTELKIDTPELKKKPQVSCRHLTAAGCGIYDKRFPICHEFLCGWRLFPELDDAWRPDLSGVLIVRLSPDNVPEAYRAPGYGMQMDITGGETAVRRPGFAEYVAGQVACGVAVQMSAASPATLVNAFLDGVTDIEDVRQTLLWLHGLLHAARWKRGVGMLLPLYRLKLEQQRAAALKNTNKSIG